MSGKTLLFGGSGFLGPVILNQYPHIVSVGRSSPPSYIKNEHIFFDSINDLSLLDNIKIDNVIFLIGNSNHHYLNNTCIEAINYNVLPLKKALSYFSKRSLKKFVCFTSILLYGKEGRNELISEKHKIFPYQNEYIFSKFLSEQVVKYYENQVPSIILRCSNIYGPTKLVRPDVIPTLIQQCLGPYEVSVWNKKPKRDFIFLEDAADIIVKLLNTDFSGILNFGTGKTTSIGQICDILEHCSGKKIIDKSLKVEGPKIFQNDISLIKSLIDWSPKYNIETGITKTYHTMSEWASECNWWKETIE
tara:strand:- start:12775 stop:13686 length:912 start_codon:yes stop_codon:yes gene_type:complete